MTYLGLTGHVNGYSSTTYITVTVSVPTILRQFFVLLFFYVMPEIDVNNMILNTYNNTVKSFRLLVWPWHKYLTLIY